MGMCGLCQSQEKQKRENDAKKKSIDKEELRLIIYRLFDQYDENKDGYLERNEAQEMIHTLSLKTKGQEYRN